MKKIGLLSVLLPLLYGAAAWGQNYVDLSVAVVNLNGTVRLSYSCNFDTYNYQGIPVDVYLLAIHNPVTSDGPSSIIDAFAGGTVLLFRPGMQSSYTYGNSPLVPTLSNVTFPPAPVVGSLLINTVSTNTYESNYAFAAVLTRHGSLDFIRSDGSPVEVSNTFSAFQYYAVVLGETIHVGDGYDPYMATWEVPYPEGKVVERNFILNPAPRGTTVLRGTNWGTYYTNNSIYINDLFASYIPGLFNGNHWSRSSFRVPYAFFHKGTNKITFKCSLYGSTGHWDNYMTKGWELFYN